MQFVLHADSKIKNVIRLIASSVVSQAILMGCAPVLTRLYTPSDFGIYAMLLSVIYVITVVASAKYECAIVLPNKDEDAMNVAAFGFFMTLIVFCFLFFVLCFFNKNIVIFLGNDNIQLWLYLIPIFALSAGIANLLNYLNIRMKKFKAIGTARVHGSLIAVISQVVIGSFKQGPTGLVCGTLISQLGSNIILFLNIKLGLFKAISFKKMFFQGKKYIDFLKYSNLSGLMNVLGTQMPVFVLGFFYPSSMVGFFALTTRILLLPSIVISNAVSQVFLQYLGEINRSSGNISEFCLNAYSFVVQLITPYCFLFFVLAPDLFAFIFGIDWNQSGIYARFMLPMFYFQFINSVFSCIAIIKERQKLSLICQFIMFTATAVSFLSIFLVTDPQYVILFFSISGSFVYFLFLVVNFKLINLSTIYILTIVLKNTLISFIVILPLCILLLFNYKYQWIGVSLSIILAALRTFHVCRVELKRRRLR